MRAPAAAVPVDERSGHGPCNDADDRVRADHETGDAEADPPHVVQVDEEERDQHPVPERADEAPELEGVDGAGELRIEAAQEPWHRRTVTAPRRATHLCQVCANCVPIAAELFRPV